MLEKLYLIICLLHGSVSQDESMNVNHLSEVKNLTTSVQALRLEEMICNQTESCQQSLDTNNQRIRCCMCDEQCSIYDDCCTDAKYIDNSLRDEKFACISTPLDGHIYMVYRCPLHYENSKIIHNCETTNKTDFISDMLLNTPVTSETKNITFKNVFCAICNQEIQFEFWNIALHYKLTNIQNVRIFPQYFTTTESDLQITSDLILYNLQNEKNYSKLMSDVYGSRYECDLKIEMPSHFRDTKRYCNSFENQSVSEQGKNPSLNSSHREFDESISNTFKINLNNSLLPKLNHCEDIPFNSHTYEMLCFPRSNSFTKKQLDSEHCFFNTFEGKPCLLNVWLKENEDFYHLDNETIFVEKYNSKFNAAEWVRQVDTENEVFLCGTEIPISDERKFHSKINYIISNILVKFSILFLIVHLIWSASDNKLQSLPNKIMYSYSSMLLIVYVLWDMEERLPSCQILAVLLHYSSLSCFTWLLIASYDCWLVICHSSAKFQTFAGKSRLKRYLLYCFWGWVSPLSIISIALYFEFAPNNKIPCYLKPGYGRLKQCFVAQETPLNYFYHYPTAVITCFNISLFLHTSYHIFKNKRKDITSTIQNTNSYVIFVRLSLNMGIVAFMVLLWALYILVVKTDFILFHTIQKIFHAAQGIFMFLLFSLDKNMLKKFLPSK
ncbi:uncharacterized protein LOC135841396 [Planococcus citri]|uniref:uncharacterized protein LOC135841396 n=1 Tax=Planococcus citri TaxID=170843 RepID=UPI0031F7D24C